MATRLYALVTSGQHGLAFAVSTGGPALILREQRREPEASVQPDRSIGPESAGTDKVGRRSSIRVLRYVGEDPRWERAKELLPGGIERDRKLNPWTVEKHLLGEYAVAPAAGSWVEWACIDIDAHRRADESELAARRRAKGVLGAVLRALNCSATRHPLILRSPGGGYHVWLPLTRGPASNNAEHTWPAHMVRQCVEWHLAEAGLKLGLGDIEVYPCGRGIRMPCGRGMVLLRATQPGEDALGLLPWPGTATAHVDWLGECDELTRWSRQVLPTVRAFVEEWPLQRRTLADWLGRPELEWDRQWGPLGWRDGHNDIPRWREILSGEKNSGPDSQGYDCRSQESDDASPRAPVGALHSKGAGKGGVRGFRVGGRSGSPNQNDQSPPSAPGADLTPDPAGGKLVHDREFREKVGRLLLEGVTQPSTRYDAVSTLSFYWHGTCGLELQEALSRLEAWCNAHPHQGSRLAGKRRKLVRACLREARWYLTHRASQWPFRGRGGHGGGMATLAPADRAVIAAVDPRVAPEVSVLLAWLAAHANVEGRVLDSVQVSHGLLQRLCGDRRVDVDGDGTRHRAATVALTELERIGVLTLARNYRVGRTGRVWSCWYRFGSGEVPRIVALLASKWEQILPFSTERLVPTSALQIVDSKSQGPAPAVVEVRLLGERVVPREGILSVLSDGRRGLPRTLPPPLEGPTASPASRPPWSDRAYRLLPFTPRRLWGGKPATVGLDIEELRALSRSQRLDVGGGGRDSAGRVTHPASPGPSAPRAPHAAVPAEQGATFLPAVTAAPNGAAPAADRAEPAAGSAARVPEPRTAGSALKPASILAPVDVAHPVRSSTSAAGEIAVVSAARAGPAVVAAAAGARPESALRAELTNHIGAAFTVACDTDVLATLCKTWTSFLARGRGRGS